MAVLQMQKFSICALKKDRNAVLKKLQSLGCTEIEKNLPEDDVFVRSDTSEKAAWEKEASLAERALAILEEYAPSKGGLLSSLEGKEIADAEKLRKNAAREDEIREWIQELIFEKKEIAENLAEAQKITAQLEGLLPWKNLDVSMDCQGTEKTALIIGALPEQKSLEELYVDLAQQAEDCDLDLTILSSDKNQTAIAAICLKKDAGKVEEALRKHGFARPMQSIAGRPEEVEKKLLEKQQQFNSKADAAKEKIIAFSDKKKEIQIYADVCSLKAQRQEARGGLLESDKTIVLEGYVPAKKAEAVKQKLEASFDLVMELQAPSEEDDSPVVLENNAFSRSFEPVLESYGLPGKKDIDPTTIMSVFYVFLFGLMLSDAAYGAIISIACFVVLKKFPKMSEGMNKSLHMFLYCGLSTLFWGVMFGGYFGDVVNVVSRVWFGHEIEIPALWFVPINDPMRLLLYSMLFGVIHLFMGLGIKGYMYLRDKDYVGFVSDVVFWFMFLIGLILILLPTDIFASIAQMQFVFPPAVSMLAKVLTIVGVLGILVMSGRSHKNPILRLALGAYDIYGITSWLSDVLSYSRLLALGLATGVIAQVVNQMGSMAGSSILGTILFIIVFLIGHTFNLAINLLGAYVHTNRLQYVEFFNKFYEGGGRPFAPFKQNTKYFEIEED
jgi:V/A-type H+/Na+-transporting ATPase subunit I